MSRAVRIEQFIVLPADAPERPPTHLDGLEAALDLLGQFLSQQPRLFEQDRGVRLDAIAVVAAQQSRHRLAERLARQVPQSDVDAADRMFDRAAAAEPEHRLPQLFAHAFRLEARLADQMRAQQLERSFDQRTRGVATSDARQPLVGQHLDERVVLHVGIGAARPAVIVRAPRKAIVRIWVILMSCDLMKILRPQRWLSGASHAQDAHLLIGD